MSKKIVLEDLNGYPDGMKLNTIDGEKTIKSGEIEVSSMVVAEQMVDGTNWRLKGDSGKSASGNVSDKKYNALLKEKETLEQQLDEVNAKLNSESRELNLAKEIAGLDDDEPDELDAEDEDDDDEDTAEIRQRVKDMKQMELIKFAQTEKIKIPMKKVGDKDKPHYKKLRKAVLEYCLKNAD